MQVEGDKTPVAASTLLEAASDLVMDKGKFQCCEG
jgi:hypothetical protein